MTDQAHASIKTLAERECPLILLNAPVLTSEGRFRFHAVDLDTARAIVREGEFLSAIGHDQTARLISRLLEIDCQPCRRQVIQRPTQRALVFRLARRLEEGKVLTSLEEILAVGFSFALLVREV